MQQQLRGGVQEGGDKGSTPRSAWTSPGGAPRPWCWHPEAVIMSCWASS